MRRKFLSYLLLFSFSLLIAGCAGPKPTIIPTSAVDTPENAYVQGMKFLETSRYDDALGSFKRAVGLDPKFQSGYVGLCLAYTGKGNYKLAETNVKKALSLDKRDPLAYVAYGRVFAAQGKFKKALKKFNKATNVDPKCAEAFYYKGHMYEQWDGKYNEAQMCYKNALTVDGNYFKANVAWERLQKAERAQTGLPSEYAKIATSNSITRADIASLFINELEIEKFIKPPQKEAKSFEAPLMLMGKPKDIVLEQGAIDIAGHWAEGYIQRTLKIGAMEIYPDGSFKPSQNINKAEFAMIVEKLIVKATGNEDLSTEFIGSTSPFPDVPNSHFAFNAIIVCTTRGILKSKMDGTFGLTDNVPGADALLSIKTLRAALE